jgi:type I restriction enzyme S subunit
VSGLHTYIARDNHNLLALGFSGYLFKSRKVRLQIMKIATGVSVLGVSKGNLEKINICLPLKSEQQKIANFLSSIDKKIEQITNQITQTKQFKKALLQQMFV